MLVADRMRVQGFHYPFPANGFVDKGRQRLSAGAGTVEPGDCKGTRVPRTRFGVAKRRRTETTGSSRIGLPIRFCSKAMVSSDCCKRQSQVTVPDLRSVRLRIALLVRRQSSFTHISNAPPNIRLTPTMSGPITLAMINAVTIVTNARRRRIIAAGADVCV